MTRETALTEVRTLALTRISRVLRICVTTAASPIVRTAVATSDSMIVKPGRPRIDFRKLFLPFIVVLTLAPFPQQPEPSRAQVGGYQTRRSLVKPPDVPWEPCPP